jgi:hypothetical protein
MSSDSGDTRSSASEWRLWFALYPVYTPELGIVWLRYVHRKRIPSGHCPKYSHSVAQKFSECLTGCWHRTVYDGF